MRSRAPNYSASGLALASIQWVFTAGRGDWGTMFRSRRPTVSEMALGAGWTRRLNCRVPSLAWRFLDSVSPSLMVSQFSPAVAPGRALVGALIVSGAGAEDRVTEGTPPLMELVGMR